MGYRIYILKGIHFHYNNTGILNIKNIYVIQYFSKSSMCFNDPWQYQSIRIDIARKKYIWKEVVINKQRILYSPHSISIGQCSTHEFSLDVKDHLSCAWNESRSRPFFLSHRSNFNYLYAFQFYNSNPHSVNNKVTFTFLLCCPLSFSLLFP